MMPAGIIIGTSPRPSAPIAERLPQAFRIGPTRIPNEFYPTPPEATRALLSVEAFDGSIWEPACGEGAIASVLTGAGYKVVATDLVDYGYGIPRVDFLKETRPRARHIVTNPPYGSGLADAFITRSLAFMQETGGSVAMLLNLASLAHRSRTSWWQTHTPHGSMPSTTSSAGPRIAMDLRRTISPSTAISGRSGPQTIKAHRPSGGCQAPSSAQDSPSTPHPTSGEHHDT